MTQINSLKTRTITALWPLPEQGHIRQLAMQSPSITAAIETYAAAANKPKMRDHFAAAVADVEARFAGGERAREGQPNSTDHSAAKVRRWSAAAAKDRARDSMEG